MAGTGISKASWLWVQFGTQKRILSFLAHWGERQISSIRRQQAGGQQKDPILKFNIACTKLKFPWNTPLVLGKDCIASWSFINGALENWEKILSKFRTNEAERKYQAAGVQIRLATGIKRTRERWQITTVNIGIPMGSWGNPGKFTRRSGRPPRS